MLGVLKDIEYIFENDRILKVILKFSEFILTLKIEPESSYKNTKEVIDISRFKNHLESLKASINKIEFNFYNSNLPKGGGLIDTLKLRTLFPFVEKGYINVENVVSIYLIFKSDYSLEEVADPLICLNNENWRESFTIFTDWREITFNVKVSIDYGN